MSHRRVEISAPARLHFGLLSFGHSGQRQFGGVGVMLAGPRMRLAVESEPTGEFVVRYGRFARRIGELARRWSLHRLGRPMPRCRLALVEEIAPHVGLGSGTQLGLAVAKGLERFHGFDAAEPAGLAESVGRGLRSAVGTYGFFRGGLIAESGRLPGERLAPLEHRVELPAAWRFLLVRPDAPPGVSGDREQAIFNGIDPVPPGITDRLQNILQESLIPAAKSGDFEQFSQAIQAYGDFAGSCFAKWQYGTFANPQVAALVQFIRSVGTIGVGQSSWGPTVFALTRDEASAVELRQRISAAFPGQELRFDVSAADNEGARIVVSDP